jgi:hypothetical protein
MPVRITLVEYERERLTLIATVLRQAGLTVTAFDDSIKAWDHLKLGDTDLLVAKVGAPPGRPCGVALALGGRYINRHLKVVFLAHEHEVQYAEAEGEVLSALQSPESVAQHIVEMFTPSPNACPPAYVPTPDARADALTA